MLGRRRFLLALGGVAAGASSACRASTASTSPTVPPREAPSVSSSALGTPKYVPEAEAYLVAVPEHVRARALALLPKDVHPGVKAGLLALSERCPFDKFKLPYCESSKWFECVNCGSRFTGLGDKAGGPSPTGMNLFRLQIDSDEDKDVSVVPRPVIPGLRYDTSLIYQRAEGPHCA